MRKTILALAAIGALGAFSSSPAAAKDYRFCLKQPEDAGGPGRCDYDTYAQCRATAQGLVADCIINPRVAFAQGLYGERGYVEGPAPRRRLRSYY